MQIASIAASLVPAVCLTASSLTTPSLAASDKPAAAATSAPLKKKAARSVKPTWDQCLVPLGLAVLAQDVPVLRRPMAWLVAKINGKRTV
jgi:hypothetical protein